MTIPIRSPKAHSVKGRAYSLYAEAAVARTASGNSGPLPLPDEISEMFVGVNVTAVAGTGPGLVVSIQQEDANGVFQTVTTTAQLTAASKAVMQIGPDHVLAGGGNFRILWEISGTAPSFTFQVGVSGR